MTAISLFWCCLNPREREVLIACLFFYASGLGYMLESDYEAIWATQGYSTTNKLVVTFGQTYSLDKGVMTDIEGNVTPVRFFNSWFWPALVVFSFDTGLGCAKPCSYLTFPL